MKIKNFRQLKFELEIKRGSEYFILLKFIFLISRTFSFTDDVHKNMFIEPVTAENGPVVRVTRPSPILTVKVKV